MIAAKTAASPVARFLDQLKAISFVKRVSFTPSRKNAERSDGTLTLHTGQEKFSFAIELKPSYLDRASTHAILAHAARSRREGHSLLLLGRYIPRPTGERLVAADVNFIDLAGNMHLALGKKYGRTILGRPETQKPEATRAVTAAQVQLLFLFAAEPGALQWPVRQIASKAGVSKSKAAQVRQLIEKGDIYMRTEKTLVRPSRQIEQLLVSGYAEVLRPKLVLGRFRSPDATGEEFLARLPGVFGSMSMRFSLTGGPAADLLQHFYRGPDIPIFLSQWSPEIQKRLRLLPDRHGSITVMRAFGEPAFWRELGSLTVAHPWLIYAELMNSEDPRAHEAAEELRREFLPG